MTSPPATPTPPSSVVSRGAWRSPWRRHLTLLSWLLAALYLTPLVWMAAVSLKSREQSAAPGVGLLPSFNVPGASPAESARQLSMLEPDYWFALARQAASNYSEVWNSPIADFPLYLHNSMLVAVLSVVGMVISSAVVAYGFSRVRWRGRDAVFVCVLGTLMIPQAVVMAPLYVLFKQWGWIGTFKPLWVPAWFGGAFSIFLLRQFFMTIPRELDEAARMDGCSHFGIFWRVVLPLSKPALATVALLQFAGTWNDFLGPLLFSNHQRQYTLAIGLQNYHQQHGGTPWNLVMAFSMMVVAPVLVLYVAARRFFVEGVGTQGIKE